MPVRKVVQNHKATMNKELAKKVIVHEKQTLTTMIVQVSTTLTTSVFITYRHHCDPFSSFFLSQSVCYYNHHQCLSLLPHLQFHLMSI